MNSISNDHQDDAVNVAPDVHSVIFEDDKVRVLKVLIKPGESAAMHWHPHNINYILVGGKLRFTKPDDTSVDVDLVQGQVTHADEGSHAVENAGTSVVETVQFELKV